MINISRGQAITVFLVCLLGLLFAYPNALGPSALKKIPSWLPSNTFNLGLDLQGGAHLLYEVDLDDATKDRMRNIRSELRKVFRSREYRIIYVRLRADKGRVTFQLRKTEQRDAALRAIRSMIRDIGASGNALTGATAEYEFDISDGGRGFIRLSDAGRRRLSRRIIEQSIEVIRKRVDETGTKDPTIQQQGDDRILLQVPGVKDPEALKRVVKTTAKMTFHLLHPSLAGQAGMKAPDGFRLVPSREKITSKDAAGKTTTVPREYFLIIDDPALDGKHLVDASQSFHEGRPIVSFRMDTTGARIFCRITQQNIRKPFAILLDNQVISAPVIQSAICGGSGIITGNFTTQSSNELALLLRAGALPAPLKVVEERTVGAELGADSIEAGKFASVLGLVLVLIFMLFAYRLFGIFANIALITNLVLITAALSLLQATLTLPGIAGIVLTIGMAVDANVLIFERIREEVRSGRTPMSAIDTGYRRALATIIDSNLTTFIAALLLFLFGSGPVQGFGVTLAIGLATSMFTAIMVTRLIVVFWWRRKRPATLPL